MAKAFFIRTLHGLVPDGDPARDCLKGVKVGQSVAVEITRPRNINHHRKYWKLVQTIADAIGADDAENVSDVLKIKTGHVRVIKTSGGLMRFPKSIAFHNMDQTEFEAFYDKCLGIICAEWLPHLKASELHKEIEELVGA